MGSKQRVMVRLAEDNGLLTMAYDGVRWAVVMWSCSSRVMRVTRSKGPGHMDLHTLPSWKSYTVSPTCT